MVSSNADLNHEQLSRSDKIIPLLSHRGENVQFTAARAVLTATNIFCLMQRRLTQWINDLGEMEEVLCVDTNVVQLGGSGAETSSWTWGPMDVLGFVFEHLWTSSFASE